MDVAHKVCLPMSTMIKGVYCPLAIAFLDPSPLVPLEHSEAKSLVSSSTQGYIVRHCLKTRCREDYNSTDSYNASLYPIYYSSDFLGNLRD